MSSPKSLYGKYLLERENINILETEIGFATYLFENDYVYIKDIFVLKEYRNAKTASDMADKIAEIAKQKGYKKMLGSVCPSTNGSTSSIQVLISYGFKVIQSTENMIYFIKEIK